MKKKEIGIFLGVLALVLGVELLGGWFTASSVKTWYAQLNKPALTPPSWVFGPTWTVLYIAMAVAVFLVWKKRGNFWAFFFWGLQLFLNLIWSYLFFTLQNPLYGLIDIVVLWFVLLITIILFARFSYWAAFLLIPYLAWITFALYLNLQIWLMNR